MKAILLFFFALSAYCLSAQIHIEYPSQRLGDTSVFSYRFDLTDSLLNCPTCLPTLKAIRANVVECVTVVTSTAEDIQLTSACFDNYIDQGSTQDETTFRLPASPVNGQICRLVFGNAVTDLSLANSGGSLLLHSSATSTSVFTYKYISAASAWKRIQ